MDHETGGDEPIFEMIEKRSAAGTIIERPAKGMLHETGLMVSRIDPPKLFEADAELLRFAIVVEAKIGDQLLGERAARTLGDQSLFAAKLHSPRKTALEVAVAGNAHVSRGNAQNLARFAIEDLGAGEARKDIDAQGLRLFAEIAHDIAKRADEIAMIVHESRHDEIGQTDRTLRAKHIEAVGRDFSLQRPVFILAPIGKECVERTRIDDRTGQNMGADFSAFFDDDDRKFRGQLFQTDRCSKTRGA